MEHDDLRAKKKQLKETAQKVSTMNLNECKSKLDDVSKHIVFELRDHIYKENYILYPTAIDAIKENSLWEEMKKKSDVIGYCPFTPEL